MAHIAAEEQETTARLETKTDVRAGLCVLRVLILLAFIVFYIFYGTAAAPAAVAIHFHSGHIRCRQSFPQALLLQDN